jgi:ubiquinone biosynthesis protein
VVAFLNLFRLFFLFLLLLPLYFFSKNRAVFYFLKLAGPSFIKLGQALSVRPDLVGKNLAEVLSKFQDQVPPFSAKKVSKILRQEFGENYQEIFVEFNLIPTASASIAQVHQAKLMDGKIAAIKILRPQINKIATRDIKTLKIIVILVGIFSKFLAKTLNDIVNLLENLARSELDLLQEAANASQLKENLKDVKGFYIPEIYWKFSTSKVLAMEWIDGIPFSNKEAILNSPFDRKEIAKNLVISYFEQVYGYGFFHADMHPGNLFLMNNGDIGAVDFGIVGKIDKKTRIAIAKILIGFLHKDYRKVAKLHIEAHLVPKDTNLEELSLAIRKIGESMVGSQVSDISIAKLLENLIVMTRDFKMDTKPELLLLQKTILLVEGVGVMLDENLNIWDLANPWVENWAKKNISFDAKIRDIFLDFIEATKDVWRKFSS